MPKVSGLVREYSRFAETIGGNWFDHDCRLGRRLLVQAKNNLGARCNGLAFRLEQRIVVSDILSSNVMFKSDHVSQPIDEALTVSEGRGGAAGGWISKGDLDG